MKRIILGRHSIAEDYPESGNDFDRKLTKQGEQLAKFMGRELNKNNILPDCMVSSDAIRAKQTAEIYANELEINEIQFQHFLYEDYSTQDFINFISKLSPEIHTILFIGHNPNIEGIAARFVTNFYNAVKPATIMVIDFDCENWNEVEVYSGKMTQHLMP